MCISSVEYLQEQWRFSLAFTDSDLLQQSCFLENNSILLQQTFKHDERKVFHYQLQQFVYGEKIHSYNKATTSQWENLKDLLPSLNHSRTKNQ